MNDYDYSKPTPGPLHVEATSRQVDMANGAPRLLSKIIHPGYLIVSAEPRGIVGLVNTERDAALLAAAPDLLAALTDLLAELPAHIGKRDVKKHYHLMVREEAARAAIRKAQGAQPA